jgi:hypothetical protein
MYIPAHIAILAHGNFVDVEEDAGQVAEEESGRQAEERDIQRALLKTVKGSYLGMKVGTKVLNFVPRYEII